MRLDWSFGRFARDVEIRMVSYQGLVRVRGGGSPLSPGGSGPASFSFSTALSVPRDTPLHGYRIGYIIRIEPFPFEYAKSSPELLVYNECMV